ncbi:alpha/beta fold hydrolase [Actinoplanes sp. NPDC049118]|uniref:thioesterase II family protein n=1 Tax=Actinoplanes sp. NPDC049118 TaxID=3155769 RepID=UPI0033DEB798
MTINTAKNTVVRQFHPAPQAPARLVCLAHAGGSASAYLPLSRELSPRVDVLAVQYPGRQDRRAEPCLTDISDLAAEAVTAILPFLDRPTALFGHSMGATVAFEAARLLEREHGHTVTRLFVSGRRAPCTTRPESVHRRDDDGLLAEIRLLSGTDSAILADDEIMRMALPALRGDYTAIETYRPEPGAVTAAPITVLTGSDDIRTSADEAAAWARHTTAGCAVHTYTGGHFFLTGHRAAVARLVARHLLG